MSRIGAELTPSNLPMGISEGLLTRDPSRDILDAQRKPLAVVHRPRVRASETPLFWQRFHADACDPLTRLAIRFTISTAVRTNETRHAALSEFSELDGKNPLWTIPGARMKMKRDHLVPLTPQVIALLKDIRKRSGSSKWLAASPISPPAR